MSIKNLVLSQVKESFSPVMAIFLKEGYSPENFEIYLESGVLGLTITGTSFSTTISLGGKTPKEISAELAEKNYPIEIKALVDSLQIQSSEYQPIASSGTPTTYSAYTDKSVEGAVIVRAYRHNIHYLEDTRISLQVPYYTSSYQAWYPRIQTGTINVVYKGKRYIFSVPEFEEQAWDLKYGKPYVRVYGEPARLITDQKIRISRTPVYWNGSNIKINVDNQSFNPSYIEDVDRWNGFIYMNKKLPTNNTIAIDYSYKERFYVYKGVDLNPTFSHNPILLGKVVLFYLIPWKSDLGIFHSKTVKHSVGSTVSDARNKIPDYGFPILVLGAIHVNNKTSIDDIAILDTRTLGGGLYPEDKEILVQAYPELNYLFDVSVYDGMPYPGNSTIIASMPEDYLKRFETKELERRLSINLSAGILPVYDYYKEEYDYTQVDNVSLFKNGDFSDRKHWSNNSPKLISNYFKITDEDFVSVNVSGNVLTLEPNETKSQYYLKTSAKAPISYYERYSSDGVEYGSWEKKSFIDSRTTEGFLLKGRLDLSAGKQYKQVKDVKIESAFTNTYSFTGDLYSSIKESFNALSGASDLSGRITGSSPWEGPTEGQIALLEMWPDPSFTGYLTKVGDSIVDSLSADSSGLSMPRLYSPESGYYLDSEWHDWTNSVEYLSKLYDLTNNEDYFTAAESIVNSINTLNPYESNFFNYTFTTSGFYFIPNQYRYLNSYYQAKAFTLSYTGIKYSEIYPGATDVETLLDGAEAYSFFNSNSQNGFRAVMAGECSGENLCCR